MFASRRKEDAADPEQHPPATGTRLRLRGLTSTASGADAGNSYAEIAETVGRYAIREALARR